VVPKDSLPMETAEPYTVSNIMHPAKQITLSTFRSSINVLQQNPPEHSVRLGSMTFVRLKEWSCSMTVAQRVVMGL
jgi:hypothetical protein